MISLLDRFAGFSLRDRSGVNVNLNLVKETQVLRVSQSHKALYLVAVSGLTYVVALWNDAPRLNLMIWIALITLTALYRTWICKQIELRLTNADLPQLYRNELWLFFTSILSTAVVGSGFWWVGVEGTDRTVFAVTMLSCIYGIGTTINSSIHFSTFPIFLILNMGQGVLFLSGLGHEPEPEVSVSLIAIILLLIQFGKRNSIVFSDSILSRDEIRRQNITLEEDKHIIELALSAAMEANADKSRFLAAASHDLRQPLQSMNLFLASLRSTVTVPKSHQILDRIDDAVNMLNIQFDSLLDLSKFDAGVVEAKYSHFDLADLLQHLTENMRPDAIEKNLTFELMAESTPVNSDRLLMERMLRNIILNAIIYTDSGFVSVTVRREADDALVSIKDSGQGIPEDAQKKIFEDFYQYNNPARKKEQGSGLGLAIVRRISELLGVSVRLEESSPGKGSSFSVRIPLSGKTEISATAKIPASSMVSGRLPALNILIIDDDPEILDALEDLIINWGCRPIRACSLVETSDIISTTRIDFAIVDDMLGDNETGLDVALHLAQTLDRDRIVMVTGNVVPRRLADIRNQGFLVFTKPSNPQKLYELIVTTHRFYDEAEINLPAG